MPQAATRQQKPSARAQMDALRKEVRDLLEGGNAHLPFDEVVREMPADLFGEKHPGLPYSAWELLEHMRIAQHDIIEFIRNPDYESPSWPDGYWPKTASPPSDKAWRESICAFRSDRATLLEWVEDASRPLLDPIPHGTGQTLLREALVVADHTAYHLGQLVAVRRAVGAWPPKTTGSVA